MMLIHEDFLRCECGSADFERKEIITIPKSARKRPENLKDQELIHYEKRIEYYCSQCKKKLDR